MLTKLHVLCKTRHLLLKIDTSTVPGFLQSHYRMASSLIKDKAFVNGQWVTAKSGATYNGIVTLGLT